MRKFLFLLLPLLILSAKTAYVNDDEHIIITLASDKISQMSAEIYEKTGVLIVLNVLEKLPQGQTITTYGKNFVKDLNGSFVVVSFSTNDKQIDLIRSDDLKEVITADNILDEYIIPILVSRNKKKTIEQKYSAAILNGMAEIADEIAQYKKITLESSIGSESKNFYEGLVVIIKIMVLLTIFAFGYAWYRGKKNAN